MTADRIVEVDGLTKTFPVRGTSILKRQELVAVRDVSFLLERGETLGIVGESGSGKSTVANIVAGLIPATKGRVAVNGIDLEQMSGRERRRQRRHVQVVFQDPYSSLAPTSTIEASIAEPLRAHGTPRHERRSQVHRLLELVGLAPVVATRYPVEMSGGQLQRVGIARALALHPELVVLDEPVSALDVSTKAEIINLLADLKQQLGLSYLFISHDLSTLRVLADHLAVMYLGSIVETGPAEQIYTSPSHPYTRALLNAVPIPDPAVQRGRARGVLQGDVPSPLEVPVGCSFHTRCPLAVPECSTTPPPRKRVGEADVVCHVVDGVTIGGSPDVHPDVPVELSGRP